MVTVAVIIPAHDEEVALGRCLVGLLEQTYSGPLEIVVVANGCEDRTAEVAQGFAALFPTEVLLRVLMLDDAAKWRALNHGDEATRADCRIYLDADIVLSPEAIDEMLRLLATSAPRLVQPEIAIEPGRKPYAVRGFVRVWSRLPYVRRQVLGLGCYAVNRSGRERWGSFPPLGADDTYVRLRFAATEKHVAPRARMTLSFPASLRELVQVRARWCRLSRIVREGEPDLPPEERRRWPAALRFLLVRPWLWADAVVFAAVWTCAVTLSRRPEQASGWARATTSRVRSPRGTEGPRPALSEASQG